MTLQQLIALFRIEAFDATTPYLFSDSECIIWANEAEMEACVRARLIREASNIQLTQFDIRSHVMTYALDPRMYEIDYASLVYKGSNNMLPYVLGITTPQELDGVRPFWRTLPYRPTGIIQYDTQLGTDSLPDTTYTIHTEGYRLPMASMALTGVTEVLASGTVTLTGGTTGNITSILVNGLDILGSPVAFTSSLTLTAAAVVTQITANTNRYTATSLNEVITITDTVGTGSLHNGYTVATSQTGTLTTTCTAFAGGVDKIVTSPEIGSIHHRFLTEWMRHRAYGRQDSETYNAEKSARALKEFEKQFGERPDAGFRKKQNSSRPHRTVAYP